MSYNKGLHPFTRENPEREISGKNMKQLSCVASVRKTRTSKFDFESKSFIGIYLRIGKNHSFEKYRFLNLETGLIVTNRSVKLYSDKCISQGITY